YHFYINGSVNLEPGKSSKYNMSPEYLDFGNDTKPTEIRDTRFEKIEVKNYSRNKDMMIIFHTPNNPKFVFHFEPQVVFLSPRRMKLVTCYMTINCTTRIRGMKIPYTVWFSKSKSSLLEIAEHLKDKNFDVWQADDQTKMDHLCKKVIRHIHHNFTISTDAASSTHIDMDELNISENPIAEGAMGRVYIGSYRSVPVAVKQFRWESLSTEEVEELKRNVIQECEIMSKLRNPFIANYMGSVTYIQQVSMVIQFFVLGSLGEYLRKEKIDYVPLPYKLKVRMLYDTSRGMEFLHENRIMHLDLKPDNLLVNSLDPNSACSIKITDFGTSRFTKKTIKNKEDKGLGTPAYAAPETFHDEYTNAGDVYSFAITAWELYYQDEPYKTFKSVFEIKTYVEEGKRLQIDEGMPYLLKNLIETCWNTSATLRPQFDSITKKLVKIDEDISDLMNQESVNYQEKIEQVINKRMDRLNSSINLITKE
ncbi:protein tyrosine kinase domain containing protein, partial [Entamoeba invadens IP1]|uniref:protein tyrosine kinase domain containing protein n=1 Tax=Entamoeba invadens IP1 TaxID=370355 RepID=UPI0002C3F37B